MKSVSIRIVHLLASVVAIASCTESEPARTEPPPATHACPLASMVCNQQPGPPVIDGHDPLWSFCNGLAPTGILRGGYTPVFYAPGVAEFDFEYHANGQLDRIDMRCDDEGPEPEFAWIAERDAADRVVRWSVTTPVRGIFRYVPRDLTYDADGMVATSRIVSFDDEGMELFGNLRSFRYDGGGAVREARNDETFRGDPSIGSITWTLEYEDGAVVRAPGASPVDSCDKLIEYGYEGGRISRMVQTAPCGLLEGRRELTYEWSGDELRRSDSRLELTGGVYTEETRYTYEDGRIAEVQRDHDGQPLATYWLDYDAEGRLTHLLWWGHFPNDPPP